MSGSSVRPVRGRVSRFDEASGTGTISRQGGGEVFFHCTAVADGSRTIDEGAEVDLVLTRGRLGRWEACWVRPR